MGIDDFAIQALTGLGTGMIIFVAALGLTLVFSICNILNLAHGSFYMIGAFLCWTVIVQLAGVPGAFWISLVLAPLGCAVFGLVMEVTILRPAYKLEFIYQFIITFAAIYFFQDLVKMIWGVSQWGMIELPALLSGSVSIGGRPFPVYYLFTIGFGLAVVASLALLMAKTRMGKVVRAMTANREMMSALGENVPRTITLVFMLGCFLAGLGGALTLPLGVARLGMDIGALISSLIVIVIGGFGSLSGALVASIVLGLVNAFGVWYVPTFAIVFPFALMVIVLAIRPWGLLGKPML